MRFYRSIFGLGLLALLVAGPVLAAAPAVRTTGIARNADKLVVSIGLQDLFGPRDIERLLSGFSTRVLIRVALLREGSSQPVAQAMRLSEIVYDLWDEKLRVRISTDKPDNPKTLVVTTPKAAVDVAASLVTFPLVQADQLQTGVVYHLSLRADLNPISEELVTNVRRWLSHPSGRSRSGSGESFFGSFVSVFVNPRIDDSERLLQVISQPFEPPQGQSP
jgi:hypothetical protein